MYIDAKIILFKMYHNQITSYN